MNSFVLRKNLNPRIAPSGKGNLMNSFHYLVSTKRFFKNTKVFYVFKIDFDMCLVQCAKCSKNTNV